MVSDVEHPGHDHAGDLLPRPYQPLQVEAPRREQIGKIRGREPHRTELA
jgi:hypothetical protein